MLPGHVYQPPVSNIAYHVYNPEDDLDRMQAVSQRAFQRIMDSYAENERLADLFQVEHEKQQQLVRERKEREKQLKQQQKKQSKRHGQGQGYPSRSQDRTIPSSTPIDRHPFRRPTRVSPLSHNNNNNQHHHPNGTRTETTIPTSAAAIAEKAEELRHQFSGSLKRARRLSDISTSDISGLGDDEVRSLPPSTSSTSRPAGLGIHSADSNDRSISNSPALPLTPPLRDSPSNTASQNGLQAGKDESDRSSNQVDSNGVSSLAASTTSSSSFAVPSLPQHLSPSGTGTGRRKRKQAIPVHPSVVERIPGITLKIQRERQGDQLEVEILKTLDDYGGPQSGNDGMQSPASKLQATQDLRKVRESIDSGRAGYAYSSPTGGSGPTQQQTPGLYGRLDSTVASNYPNRSLDWSKSLPGSLSSLSWTSSNTNSTENLTAMQESIDARSMPLSWENFSTRECVVNKLVGKHDRDLNILEEVVQDAIARQQYAIHLQHEQEEQERLRAQSLTPVDSHRGLSVGFTGSDNGATGEASNNHHPTSSRASKPVAPSTMRTRSTPARATRSKAQSSSRGGHLVAHEDIERILKQKRRRQREEQRRRQSSKTSSKDGEEDEDNDEERDYSRRTTLDGDESQHEHEHTDDAESDDDKRKESWVAPSTKPTGVVKRKYTRRKTIRRNFKDDEVPTSASDSSSDDESVRKDGGNRYQSSRHGDDDRAASESTSKRSQKKTFKQAPRPDRSGDEPIRRNKKFWSRGRNTRKEDEVDDTADTGSDDDDEEHDDDEDDTLRSRKPSGSATIQTRLPDSWMRKKEVPSSSRKDEASEESSGSEGPDAGQKGPKPQKYSRTLNSSAKAHFFNTAVELIQQKNLEMLEKRRKGQGGVGRRREALLKQAEVDKEKELEREREMEESRVKLEGRLVEESKAQKVESTNLPRSSKSLPGRVLRRAIAGGAGTAGGEDPDCTSCRLALSAAEKDAWKVAQEKGEIRLPKTWGTHAILCVACRNQYLGHHSRCTACFYVPVEEEMESSGKRCSRCKAGTWLTEMVPRAPGDSSADDKKDRRRRQASDMSM